MKLSAMTLGCPNWDLDTILTNIKNYGFDGVDFRGIQKDLDITKMPEFTTHLAATAKRIKDSGLEVSGISSSLTVCDPAKRAANVEEARRTIPVALALGAKNVIRIAKRTSFFRAAGRVVLWIKVENDALTLEAAERNLVPILVA